MRKYLLLVLLSGLFIKGFSQNIFVVGKDTLPPYGIGKLYELKPTRVESPLVLRNDTTIGINGAALTKTDDTNLGMTLTGTPTTALLASTNIALNWLGTLGGTRGGTGQSTTTTGDLLVGGASNTWNKLAAGSTSGYVLTSNGAGVAPSYQAAGAGGGAADSSLFWSRSLNTVANGDKFGASNNRSVNMYTNNTRWWMYDSLGAIQVFPGSTPRNILKVWRHSSTSVVAFTLALVGDEPTWTSGNASMYFNLGSGGTVNNFTITSLTPTATIASPVSTLFTGKTRFKTITPTGTNITPAFSISESNANDRFSMGLDVNVNAVMRLHNTGLRIDHDNGSLIGDVLNIFPSTGSVQLQNKGTFTEETSARLNVSSTNQGSLVPRMTTTQRTNILGSMLAFIQAGGGTSYGNGTYTNVALTGGVGSGATINFVVTGGVIGSVVFNNRGTGYASSTSGMGVNNSDVGGTGSGFSITCTAVATLAEGLEVYDLTLHKKYIWDGTTWNALW